MRGIRISSLVLGLAIMLAAVSTAQAIEIIQLRTGQSGGAPGVCPNPDDTFTYNPVGIQQCGTPFRPAPFTAADFAAAAGGPPARVITAAGPWLPALGADPLARWIDWQPAATCLGQSNSALYAARFNVTTPCSPVGDVTICWAVDDGLGDVPAWGGPNPIGVYLNGVALNPGFSGGNYGVQTCFTQTNVPLNTGANYLYVYQRDQGCAVAGLLLTARISVTASQCPSITVLKFNDLNGDGVQGPGENGLPGWQVNISGPVTQSATTGPNGQAWFQCLPPGTYQITETTQPGWVQTFPANGAQFLTIACGQDYIAYIGNRQCVQGSNCVPLPSCLSAWFPLDECSGTTANEVTANRDGTILGGGSSPTWGAGSWGSPCALNFPGLPGTQQVAVPDYPEHDFGTGSFSIVAWVRTQQGNQVVRTILDKRQTPFMTPTGYSLYLYQGIFRFQYGAGGPFQTHVSTAPSLADGNWHLVAVTACRNPNNPAANVVRLIVDNHVDTFTGASVVAGNLSNTAGLRMGDQCPGFIVGVPFMGAIDGVQLYKCCLSADQVMALHTDIPYCNLTCHVPSIISTPFASTTTNLTLCNYAPTPRTLTWTIAPLPSGPGCSVGGPTVFGPYAGTVTLPAASSGPSCITIPISITLPAGMTWGQTTCYQVTTLDEQSGRCCVTRGRIRRTWPHHIWAEPHLVSLPPGIATPIHFTVENGGGSPLQLSYQVADLSTDGDESNRVVSLNGLPPGEPVLGTLSVAPGGTGVVTIEALLSEFQPLNAHEVVLSADLDGDGVPEDIACATLESGFEDLTTGVPGVPPAVDPAPAVARLSARPNPFRASTGIELDLAGSESAVRVEVFDVGGRLVRALFAGPLQAGAHSFTWDGRDEVGRSSGNGLYFLRARTAKGELETKLIRLQ